MRAAMVVKNADGAGDGIDPLDAAAGVVGRRAGRAHQVHLQPPRKAAVVADVKGAVRPDRQPVRAAAGVGDHLGAAVGLHAGDGLALDLAQHDGAVFHRDRAFRKAQAGGDGAEYGHGSVSPRFYVVVGSVTDLWKDGSR